MSYLFAIFLFSFLIFIHEFGHFIAAKSFGVQVNEFSVFMGPSLWQKQIGETLYSIRCIPIGGYCAMEGEDGGSDNPRSFGNAKWWNRLIILVAGAAMNFITGVLLLGIFFAPFKQFVVPVVSSVEEECAFAGENGIQAGDRIVSVDGERVFVYSDFNLIMSLQQSPVHDLVLERDGRKVVLNELLMEKRMIPNADGAPSLRYGFNFSVVKATLPEKIAYIWNSSLDTARLVKLSLQMLVSGRAGIQDVSGPVGIVSEMAEVAKDSPDTQTAALNLIYFGGFIAINLAVMNLLPIPALDGGRVVGLLLTSGIEAITKKKIDPRYEGFVHGAGMMLLLALMALIMFKDIIFVIKR